MDTKPNVAVVASKGLGDGIIFLVLANNLARNDYNVTFYNNFIADLQEWLPHIKVKRYPNKNDLDKEFSQFDLVISERVTPITDNVAKKNYSDLAKKYVFISCVRHNMDDELVFDQSEILAQKITDLNKLNKLLPLAKSSGALLPEISKTLPLVETITILCRDYLLLTNCATKIDFVPTKDLVHKKHAKRIIIHPTSTDLAKNWPAKKFIKLAEKLTKDGWQPVFIVGPNELATWQALVNSRFLVKSFAKIDQLAAYIYESQYMIGNDSGIGHLASALGLATLTIAGTGTKQLRWRPGFADNEVVNAPKLKIGQKKFWQYLVPVARVYWRFKRLVNRRNAQFGRLYNNR